MPGQRTTICTNVPRQIRPKPQRAFLSLRFATWSISAWASELDQYAVPPLYTGVINQRMKAPSKTRDSPMLFRIAEFTAFAYPC